MNFNPCHAESNKIFHKSCERWKDQLYNQLTTTKKKDPKTRKMVQRLGGSEFASTQQGPCR